MAPGIVLHWASNYVQPYAYLCVDGGVQSPVEYLLLRPLNIYWKLKPYAIIVQ